MSEWAAQWRRKYGLILFFCIFRSLFCIFTKQKRVIQKFILYIIILKDIYYIIDGILFKFFIKKLVVDIAFSTTPKK